MSFISSHFNKLPLLILLPVLSACVEDGPPSGPGGYRPPPRPQPQMCTMDYRPVCGERGGRFETFGNACQADARGFRIVSSGECRGPGITPPPGRPDRPDRPGRPDRPDWDRPGRPDRPDMGGACTREYRPVCARAGRGMQTFPNACEAERAGAGIIASGQCPRG
ncbi:Kazal-type serine protease inhibitor domain-containing protein [Neorhizobium sp. NCHU2750]|uniref:Kazal-type serine protease inhibitor domain-containing protein n=1 Tax=Neorhizobium sp. NCHU2750 TaxID=1825976 RepID=UPI000EB6A5A3|nr:hypothetical protein NCHU2750_22800 [Neorhizobium sp. NCHU2750]